MAADALAGHAQANSTNMAKPVMEIVAAKRKAAQLPPPDTHQVNLANILGAAAKDLMEAGLLKKRGPLTFHGRLTEEGKRVVGEMPDNLDVAYLRRFPAFNKAKAGAAARLSLDRVEKAAWTKAVKLTAGRVATLSRKGFGRLAGELARALAARDALAGEPGPADGGDCLPYFDIAASDGAGRLAELMEFAYSMEYRDDRNWALFATGSFRDKAIRKFDAVEPRVKAVGPHDVAELMVSLGVGIKPVRVLALRQIDPDFFSDPVRDSTQDGPDQNGTSQDGTDQDGTDPKSGEGPDAPSPAACGPVPDPSGTVKNARRRGRPPRRPAGGTSTEDND
jgi:restriction endonuclease Mrr